MDANVRSKRIVVAAYLSFSLSVAAGAAVFLPIGMMALILRNEITLHIRIHVYCVNRS